MENSVIVNFLRRVCPGSLVVRLASSCGGFLIAPVIKLAGLFTRAAFRIVDGSRFIGLFRVNDYLDTDRSPLWDVCRRALGARLLRATAGPLRGRLAGAWKGLAWSESLVYGSSSRTGLLLRPFFSRKNMMAAVLAFLAGFFLVQRIMLGFLPAARLLFPWSAGLCLGLFLILLLFAVEEKVSRRAGEAGMDHGFIMGLFSALLWVPSRFLMLAGYLRVVCRKIIFGAGPPVEGGDV
ncbi:MAG: hypothetical protein JXQ83_03985 [Candidatus Glassbacteria bacterium]|nr:hypothetical protein [Candidatus Glassbacteria bacterium]